MLRRFPNKGIGRPKTGTVIMSGTVLVFGLYLLVPIAILLIMSFDTAANVIIGPAHWGFANWVNAWRDPQVAPALLHSLEVWLAVSVVSFPVAVGISLVLARTNMYLSRGLEFMFWVAFIFPPLASAYGWIDLLAPDWGFLNRALALIPGVHSGPFNVYSFWGIVFVRLMTDGIAYYVVLLTPVFRNMDGALEEASRVSGSSNLRTMIRVTLPMMAAPMLIVGALQLIKFFQGFEVEYLLGSQFGYYVYSTLIYQLIYVNPSPQYSNAIVLASVTLLIVGLIIPLQRWVVHRRQYTTVGSNYKAGLIDLGRFRGLTSTGISVLLVFLTVVPVLTVLVGSFMVRVGFFSTHPLWTLSHWSNVLNDPDFLRALLTTVLLAVTAGVVSPIVFSLLAYMIVRTRWRGRTLLDGIIWGSAALPGILLGMGLLIMFLVTPGLKSLFGTIWPLLIVVIVAGITTGTNLLKGVLVQLHTSLEEASRVSGASWLRTYLRIVVPVLRPTMVLVGMLSFVGAANSTSSIILLASRNTETLSILSLQLGSGAIGKVEEGGIISLIIMLLSLGMALPIRIFALRTGVHHKPAQPKPPAVDAAPASASPEEESRAPEFV